MKNIKWLKSIGFLVIITFIIGLTTCKTSQPFVQRYYKGDVVYIKPDSTMGIVHDLIGKQQIIDLELNVYPDNYYVIKFVKNGVTTHRWIKDKDIY